MITEKEKMISGQIYNSMDEELVKERMIAKKTCRHFNDSDPEHWQESMEILKPLLGSSRGFMIESGFQCIYGYNIHLGEGFYANFACVILDAAPVRIGKNVMFGPGVNIFTANHALDAIERVKGVETALPVTIGDNVWVGGRVVICPGVTIGSNTTIGAGSVVTKDIPDNVLAVGNPCRVIRENVSDLS